MDYLWRSTNKFASFGKFVDPWCWLFLDGLHLSTAYFHIRHDLLQMVDLSRT